MHLDKDSTVRPVITLYLKGDKQVVSIPLTKDEADTVIKGYEHASNPDSYGTISLRTFSDGFVVVNVKQIRHIAVSRYPRSNNDVSS